MPTDGATEVTILAPAWTRLLGFVGSAGLVAGGYFLIRHSLNQGVFGLKAALAGWLSIVFFGACSLAYAIQLIPRFRDRVIIREDGFSASKLLRLKHYAWTDITGRFAIWQMRRTKMVVFNISREKRNLNHALSGHNGYLPAHLRISAESLAALMNRRLEGARGRPSTPFKQAAYTRPTFGRKGTG